jgi:hypothetical protein
LIKNIIRLKEVNGWTLNKVFFNPYYNTDQILVNDSYKVSELGFRHIFVKSGEGILEADDQEIHIKEGWSYIHTADTEQTVITNTNADPKQPLDILLTYTKNY